MMKKLAVLLLSVFLCFAFVSCGGSENENEAEVIPEIPTVTEETLTVSKNDGAVIDIKATYPVIVMKNTEIADRINSEIKAYVDSLYAEYETETFTAAADSFYSKMQYEVTLCTAERLSIHIFALYCQDGPQYVYDHGFTFDLKTGELLKLTDLYTEKQIDKAIRRYFSSVDQAEYPTVFLIYSLDSVAQNFLDSFSSKNASADSVFLYDYYLREDSLCLLQGLYKGYTDDIKSPLSGDRAFIAEIPLDKIPAAE